MIHSDTWGRRLPGERLVTASAKALKSVSVSLVPSRGLKKSRWLELNDKGWEGIKQE